MKSHDSLFFVFFLDTRHRISIHNDIVNRPIDVNWITIDSNRYFCTIRFTALLNMLDMLYGTPLNIMAEFPFPGMWTSPPS